MKMITNNLRNRLQEFFFTKSFLEDDLENVSKFLGIMHKTQEAMVVWKNIFSGCEKDMAIMEYKLENVPSVLVGELETVMTQFIAFAAKERDSGCAILGDELLNA